MSENEQRKPDWRLWRDIDHATLPQVVALSCNLDPDGLSEGNLAEGEEFQRRRRVAENHAIVGRLPVVAGHDRHDPDCAIRLAEFGKWAASLNWSLPEQFPLPAGHAPPPPTPWPWGAYETPLLRELAAAVKHFWAKHDPAGPHPAPSNEDVVTWLTARGVAVKRNAEAIAKIIRTDAPHVSRPARGKE